MRNKRFLVVPIILRLGVTEVDRPYPSEFYLRKVFIMRFFFFCSRVATAVIGLFGFLLLQCNPICQVENYITTSIPTGILTGGKP